MSEQKAILVTVLYIALARQEVRSHVTLLTCAASADLNDRGFAMTVADMVTQDAQRHGVIPGDWRVGHIALRELYRSEIDAVRPYARRCDVATTSESEP